jgi:hypothetical protein
MCVLLCIIQQQVLIALTIKIVLIDKERKKSEKADGTCFNDFSSTCCSKIWLQLLLVFCNELIKNGHNFSCFLQPVDG